MRVVVSSQHQGLNKKLAKEINRLAKNFNIKNYSRIENIDKLLLKRDISVEKKKSILLRHLHDSIATAFSIDKRKFNKSALGSLKKRLHSIRKVIGKLRSINYYLETAFLQDLKLSEIKSSKDRINIRQQDLARDELEALEYTAYRLIGEAAMLDKKLLQEYSKKEAGVVKDEKSTIKDIGWILKKESALLEHLEAKLPPPRAAGMALLKEPVFTHWVARLLALLSYLEHFHNKEKEIFSRLKKSKSAKAAISRKIIQIIREKSELLRIMAEKETSMKKSNTGIKFKKEIHNLTAAINL